MSSDTGIIISPPGVNATGAKANQLAMNTSNPFIKIDTQNAAGFQTITMLITTNIPAPGGTPSYTVLYKYKHGYTYIPSIETLVEVTSPPAGVNSYQAFFQDSGVIGQIDTGDYGQFYAVADATYVYYILLYSEAFGSPITWTGTNLLITTHVFVEDIGI